MRRRADIFHVLQEQNREAVALLAGLVGEEDETRRESLFDLVRDRLLRQARAEAEVYYGELERFDSTREDAAKGRREHGRVMAQLDAIELRPPDVEEWPDRLAALKKTFEKHARRERTSFRRARGVLPAHRRRWLGGLYLEALVDSEEPATSGHPHAAPSSR